MRLRNPVQLSQGAAIIDMFKDVGADGNIDVCVGKIDGFYVKRKVCPAWLDVRSYVLPAYGFDKARYGGFGGEMQNARLAKEMRVVIKPQFEQTVPLRRGALWTSRFRPDRESVRAEIPEKSTYIARLTRWAVLLDHANSFTNNTNSP